jgi:hypothetical protein
MTTKSDTDAELKARFDTHYGYCISEEDFQLYKNRIVDLCLILIEMDKERRAAKVIQEQPTQTKEAILQSMVEIHDNASQPIAGKETIMMVSRFDEVIKGRELAADLKERLISNIKSSVITKLNFKDVKAMDASFADALIAQVVILAGKDHFERKVVITNANKDIKNMINRMIQGRIDLYTA